MTFDFDAITVGELDEALKASKFSDKVRGILAKVTGKTLEEINAMKPTPYKRLVSDFVTAAYDPVGNDPN